MWSVRRVQPSPWRRRDARVHRCLLLEELEGRTLPSTVAIPATSFASPIGYTPGEIRHAYAIDAIRFTSGKTTVAGTGAGQTIAIVDAYNDPQIVNDLAAFDLAFGLPAPKFTRIGETGGALPTQSNAGWAIETSLDVEWAHAIAPGANILLVEANSSNTLDLYTAVETAAKQPGVSVVSMSFGTGEFFGENANDSTFITPLNHGGITFVASTGDNGAPGGYPAYSPDVLAVGGTRLSLSTAGNYMSETGWGSGAANEEGSGGGQSVLENEPSFQFSVQHSGRREIPDVAFDADPQTPVPVYDSFGGTGSRSWFAVGGTSFAAPSWAALLAIANQGRVLANNGTLVDQQALIALYALPQSDFHEILSGNNGFQAGFGYNLVTGLGSPQANLVVAGLVAAFPGVDGSDATSAGSVQITPGHAIPSMLVAAPHSNNLMTVVSGDTVVGERSVTSTVAITWHPATPTAAAATRVSTAYAVRAETSANSLDKSTVAGGVVKEADVGTISTQGSTESAFSMMQSTPEPETGVTDGVDRMACEVRFEGSTWTPQLTDLGAGNMQATLEQGADPTAIAALAALGGGYWFEQGSVTATRWPEVGRKRVSSRVSEPLD
jgi:subtilase family serine protease